MKVIAFYAAGLLMLFVMVFGGIEGFSFEFRIETSDYISETEDLNTAHNHSLPKQTRSLPEKNQRVSH